MSLPTQSPLPATWDVPQEFHDRFGKSVGRQRIMFAQGHLLLILHAPPKAEHEHRAARFFWRTPEGEWQSNALGPGIAALRKHLSEYAESIERLDTEEEQAELADDYLRLLQEIGPIRRASRNMHDTLQESRQALSSDRDLIIARDEAYALHRRIELLQGDARSGLDCATARRAEEQAASSHRMAVAAHRLNVLATIFFPIVTLASIFGMNLETGIETAYSPWLFVGVLVVGVYSGLLLKAVIVNRATRPPREQR